MKPFALSRNDSVQTLGESELIEKIRDWLGTASPQSPAGIGDDCSAIPLPGSKSCFLTTADPVIYQRHFDDLLSPEKVASKLLKRNISDIASMGGEPRHATLSLAIPGNLSIEWLHRFYSGLSKEALNRNIQINGGDISSTDNFVGAFMTLIGFTSARLLERKGAKPKSRLFVSGTLGGSGLRKHYAFEPRLKEGQWLANHTEVLSCMDLSDGLGKDCASLASKDCAVLIDSKTIPISDDAKSQSSESGRSALDHAINDGEDYELLFSLNSCCDTQRFQSDWERHFNTRLTQIGYFEKRNTGQPSVSFLNLPDEVTTIGYEHFRSA